MMNNWLHKTVSWLPVLFAAEQSTNKLGKYVSMVGCHHTDFGHLKICNQLLRISTGFLTWIFETYKTHQFHMKTVHNQVQKGR